MSVQSNLQAAMFAFIADNPGCNSRDIAQATGRDLYTVCSHLAVCVKRGYIARAGMKVSYRYFSSKAEAEVVHADVVASEIKRRRENNLAKSRRGSAKRKAERHAQGRGRPLPKPKPPPKPPKVAKQTKVKALKPTRQILVKPAKSFTVTPQKHRVYGVVLRPDAPFIHRDVPVTVCPTRWA